LSVSPELLDHSAHVLAQFVAGGIFVNQLDELHVDAQYFLRRLHRASARAASNEELSQRDKLIAIAVPAWHESEVIGQMLEHNLATLDYDRDRYHIFCGTYPNDRETQLRVDAVAARASNVHRVVLPHNGPTSKADCLNHVYREICALEGAQRRRFDVLLLHDAEDVIHPLSLRLYASLVPAYDLVQTPVFSLPVAATRLVAGTYIDEFAEHHLKEMLVRQAIGGLVPSAGVGTAFARGALEAVAAARGGQPFDVESLTEDYDIALRFRLANRRVHFACCTVGSSEGEMQEYIATREYFPSGFRASIRQRSRWILGITLQGWRRTGWTGPLPVLYCLWRDRKALVTNGLTLLAYLLVAFVALRSAFGALFHRPWGVDRIVEASRVLWWLLLLNLLGAIWRGAMKAYFVGRLSGGIHAVLSAPRLVVGNVIGISATFRAVSQYLRHVLRGGSLRWLKTTHSFLEAGTIGSSAPFQAATSTPTRVEVPVGRLFDERRDADEDCRGHGDSPGGGEARAGGA
jgi:adsorption protein B